MKELVIMSREYVELIEELVEGRRSDELKERLAELHPADIAELCDDMSIEDARYVYHLLEGEEAADVLIEMDEDARNELLEDLPSETIAKKFVDSLHQFLFHAGADLELIESLIVTEGAFVFDFGIVCRKAVRN